MPCLPQSLMSTSGTQFKFLKNILSAVMYRDMRLDHRSSVDVFEVDKSLAWARTTVDPRDTV